MTPASRPPGRECAGGPVFSNPSRPAATPPLQDAEVIHNRVARGGDSDRTCEAPRCGRQLTGRQRRFCSGLCRVRGQRAERVIEDDSYAAGIVRLIRTMGVRASADVEALKWLAGAVEHARAALAMAVDGCRARGYSDAEIGHALGISRQAVGQRFGRKRDVHAGTPESGAAP